jgi:broad specificity phosphatase PhoE
LILLVRHGATEWSVAGRHTGRTDMPLTEAGMRQATALGPLLWTWVGEATPVVYTSPLARATQTAALALPEYPAETVDALVEYDYGAYEGMTTSDILARDPEWDLFGGGCPGGESVMQVAARCDAFVAKLERTAAGKVVVAFTHGHLSRILTTRLLSLPNAVAAGLWNDTASLAAINLHRQRLVLVGWNLQAH